MKIAPLRRPAASAGLLVLGMALGGCATTCVPGGVPPPPRQSEAPMPPRGGRPDPAFHEALQACAQAQGITLPAPGQGAPADAGVRPDRDKLDACLKARGFEHPPGPPPGPGGPDGPGMPPPPPRDPAFAAAFKACATEQGVQLPAPGDKPVAPGEKPAPPAARPALDRDRLDACLSGKGFKRPAPGERDGGRPPAPVPAAS